MFKHFLIPTDGSPVSRKAAKAGIALARRLGARVTAYSTVEAMQPVFAEGYALSQKDYDAFEKRARAIARNRVDAIFRMAEAAGVRCGRMVTRAFTPYEGIVAAARKGKCDAIFMASHGRRGITRLIMGSVTQKVLSHTRKPVVVYQ